MQYLFRFKYTFCFKEDNEHIDSAKAKVSKITNFTLYPVVNEKIVNDAQQGNDTKCQI